MVPNNKSITISGEDLINVLKEIELILVSLHDMGPYYVDHDKKNYEAETTRFIDEWQVTKRLAYVRKVLSEKFDLTLGDDDMDDLERAMESVKYWSAEGDFPEKFNEDKS